MSKTLTEQDFAPAISEAATYPIVGREGGIILETGLLVVDDVGDDEEGYVMDADAAFDLTDHLPDGPFLGIWYTKLIDGIDQDDKEKAAYTCGSGEDDLGAATLLVITPSWAYMLDEKGIPFYSFPHKSE